MPGIGMRTATIAIIEQHPSASAEGGNSDEVVSTISGVFVKQVQSIRQGARRQKSVAKLEKYLRTKNWKTSK